MCAKVAYGDRMNHKLYKLTNFNKHDDMADEENVEVIRALLWMCSRFWQTRPEIADNLDRDAFWASTIKPELNCGVN